MLQPSPTVHTRIFIAQCPLISISILYFFECQSIPVSLISYTIAQCMYFIAPLKIPYSFVRGLCWKWLKECKEGNVIYLSIFWGLSCSSIPHSFPRKNEFLNLKIMLEQGLIRTAVFDLLLLRDLFYMFATFTWVLWDFHPCLRQLGVQLPTPGSWENIP